MRDGLIYTVKNCEKCKNKVFGIQTVYNCDRRCNNSLASEKVKFSVFSRDLKIR